jgi:hypothetical protein
MNLKLLLKKITLPEILVLVVFVLYLVFPVSTPSGLAPYIESPLGLLSIFAITVGLFLYTHPFLGVLYLFVAYTLLRRSAVVKNTSQYVEVTRTPAQKILDVKKQVAEATPPQEEARNVNPGSTQPITLEEEVVMQRAPIGKNEKITIMQTTFKPVATNTIGASMV